MKYPTLFVNHGGGPMPLLGRQPDIVRHMQETVTKWLPSDRPKAVVVVSAHWESSPIRITSSPKPSMYFDYYGFPSEAYKFDYPAPGHPTLAARIQQMLLDQGLEAELDEKRGFDHGVFIPLMMMYPEADIPVVCVSLHSSLSPKTHLDLGNALAPLRNESILILGSGYTFHNLPAFFNPTSETLNASKKFNDWLKGALLQQDDGDRTCGLLEWHKAPGARVAHPREEHLIPLFVVAAAGGGPGSKASLIYDTSTSIQDHAISSYMFE